MSIIQNSGGFQVRKTPLSSRDCGPGLGFRPQSHSSYGYGASH